MWSHDIVCCATAKPQFLPLVVHLSQIYSVNTKHVFVFEIHYRLYSTVLHLGDAIFPVKGVIHALQIHHAAALVI